MAANNSKLCRRQSASPPIYPEIIKDGQVVDLEQLIDETRHRPLSQDERESVRLAMVRDDCLGMLSLISAAARGEL